MSRPTTRIALPGLRQKVLLLCAHRAWRLGDLAHELHLSVSVLSGYLNGVAAHTGKPAESMPRDKLPRFAELLKASSPSSPTLEQAIAAWQAEDLAPFAQLLRPRRITNLDSLLAEDKRRLSVRTQPVSLQSLGILADDERPGVASEAAMAVNHEREGVRFQLATSPGACLFAACATSVGWHQVVPSSRHTGSVASSWEWIPAHNKPISFNPPLGRHRFVFIQAHLADLHARDPNLGLGDPLHDAEIEHLANALAADKSPGWCWGEAVLNVT